MEEQELPEIAGGASLSEREEQNEDDAFGAGAATHSSQVDVMHWSDERLQGMLKMARGVLRSNHLPKAVRAKDMHQAFSEWDSQAAEAAAEKAVVEGERASSSTAPPPDPAMEELAAELAAASPLEVSDPAERQRLTEKLRRDVQRLERANAKRRQEWEDLFVTSTNLAVNRFRETDRLETAEATLARGRRDLREAKEMVKIQEREIKELRGMLEAAAKPRDPQVSGRRGRNKETAGPQGAGVHLAPRPKAKGGISAEEAKSALLQEQVGEPDENRIKGHLNNENEKLVSVIESVGELSRQLASRSGQASQCCSEAADDPADQRRQLGRIGGPSAADLAHRPSAIDVALGVREKRKDWASYSAALSAKRDPKLFMF